MRSQIQKQFIFVLCILVCLQRVYAQDSTASGTGPIATSPTQPTPVACTITHVAPIEAYGTDGALTGVTNAVVGQSYQCLRVDGSKAVLQGANGQIFKIQTDAVSQTPSPPPVPTPVTDLPTTPPPLKPTVAAPPPAQPVVPTDKTGLLFNYILTIEVYNLSQDDGNNLIEKNASSQARYDQIRELVKADKAHLDAVLCGAVMSGHQAVAEQVDVVSYAVALNSSGEGTDYKKRNTGYRLVFHLSANPDEQTCGVGMYLEHTFLKGFTEQSANNQNGTSTPALPEFTTIRANSPHTTFPYEKIQFVGSYNPSQQDAPSSGSSQPDASTKATGMSLVFGRVSKVQLDPGPLTPETIPNNTPAQFEHQLSFFSMDRDKARQILAQEQKPDSAYQAVQALVASNDAKLEHLVVLEATSGLKGSYSEATEKQYSIGATTMNQDIGYSGDVKPDANPQTGLLTIYVMKSQLISDAGKLHLKGYDGDQPMFALQSLSTMLNSATGEHELLGTFSPVGNSGVADQEDTGVVWLEFIQTTAKNP